MVEPSFARTFFRHAVLAARLVETPADRKRRDALWLEERRKLWEPLFLLKRIVCFPLRIGLALETGLEHGIAFTMACVVIYIGIALGLTFPTQMQCWEMSYAERHSCAVYDYALILPETWVAVADESWMRVMDHYHRQLRWLESGRLDIGGCWAHPIKPLVEPVPAIEQILEWISTRMFPGATLDGFFQNENWWGGLYS